MRVPPAQSSTDAATFASATSTSRCLQVARDVGEPRAEHEHVHAMRGRW